MHILSAENYSRLSRGAKHFFGFAKSRYLRSEKGDGVVLLSPTKRLAETFDGLDRVVEKNSFFIFECRLAKAPHPVGSVWTPFEAVRRRHHAIKFRQAARVRVGIALHQAPASEQLDGKRIIFRSCRAHTREPCIAVFHLLQVTRGAATKAAEPSDGVQHEESAEVRCSHAASAIDDAIERFRERRPLFNEAADEPRQTAEHFLNARMHE